MNTDHLKELAQAALPKDIADNYPWPDTEFLMEEGFLGDDAAYIAAASPDAILALIARVEELEEALEDTLNAAGGYSMMPMDTAWVAAGWVALRGES